MKLRVLNCFRLKVLDRECYQVDKMVAMVTNLVTYFLKLFYIIQIVLFDWICGQIWGHFFALSESYESEFEIIHIELKV